MKWEILEKNLLSSWITKLWQVKLRFQKFNGRMSNICNWLFIEKDEAVAILLFDSEAEKLLLVKQFRLIAHFFDSDPGALWPLEVVAGMVHKQEAAKNAAIRECQEEIGLKITDLKQVLSFYPSPGIFGERVNLYYAEFDSSKITLTPQGVATDNEDVMPILVSLKEALNLIDGGKIVDSKTITAILWLWRHLSVTK